MRVLLAAHAFPPRSTAGVEVYLLRLAKALRAQGHEVLVLAGAHDLAAEPYSVRRREHEGVAIAEVVNVHHEGTLEATYDNPGVDRAVAPVVAEFRPDVLHAHHLLNLSMGLLPAARRAGASFVLTLHDYWLSCARDGLRMRADLSLCPTIDHETCARCLADSPYLVPSVQRSLAGAARVVGLGRYLHRIHDLAPRATEAALGAMRQASPGPSGLRDALDRRAVCLRETATAADCILAPTRFARDRAVEFGLPESRLRVVPLGSVAGPARARRAGPRPRLAYVGTLAPHKGLHVLIEAFRSARAPEATLDIHGNPAMQPAYADALRRAADGDPRIRFRGPFAEGGQEAVLGAADALVVPSLWWENSPLVVQEALAAGLPVVGSATGGMPEILEDGVTGVLVRPGDAAALRVALEDVVAGRRLGGARAPVRLKTIAEGAEELVSLYAEAREARVEA